MFDITKLLDYDQIVIQCHNNPDADSIASAFALHTYLAEMGKDAEIIYGGQSEIQKKNLLIMTEELCVPIRYIPNSNMPNSNMAAANETPIFDGGGRNILVMVDCQYGGGNAVKFAADEVAVIDHHPRGKAPQPEEMCDIRPNLGSCSTLVWSLLRDAGFDFKKHIGVGTALYYGLYTDTGSLSEITHPLDKDLRDIKFDVVLINKLKNTNLSIEDLSIATSALNNHKVCGKTNCAVFEATSCDQNLLGIISDLAIQIDSVDVSVVFCAVEDGFKLSIRSCVPEVMANELAKKICGGGGHKRKAGGFIGMSEFAKHSASAPSDFLLERLTKYFNEYDHVYCGRLGIDVSTLPKYRKKAITMGFVRSMDLIDQFPQGTELLIRTLEGDTYVTVEPDTYIMVGVDQVIWPIKRAKFEASYRKLDTPYFPYEEFNADEYKPTVQDRVHGKTASFLPYANSCIATSESVICAKRLERRTKVFTAWNPEGYMTGEIGDWLAIRGDDVNDAYVIKNIIFDKTYTII